MDFNRWVVELEAFICRGNWPGQVANFHKLIAPTQDVGRASFYRHIPLSLQDFWQYGSSHIECGVTLEFSGPKENLFERLFAPEFTLNIGVCIMHPSQLMEDPIVGFRDLESESGQEHARLWRTAIPFCDLGNGDYLALDAEDDLCDPPVVALVHEDASSGRVSDSFTEFLFNWKAVLYLHPFLLPYCYNEHGQLKPSDAVTSGLAELFEIKHTNREPSDERESG